MVRSRTLLAVLALIAITLAGCSDKKATPDENVDLGLEATEDTGIIRGVVVDNAIRPIMNAQVTVRLPEDQGNLEMTTVEDGLFGFDGLEPGSYVVEVTKLGYFSVQQTATVVANVADPDSLRVLMEVDAESVPYFRVQVFEGFIECTSSVVVLCGAPNLFEPLFCDEFDVCYGNLTNDQYTPTLYFDASPDLIQVEMVWETTQTASPELYLEIEALDEGCEGDTYIGGVTGSSPVFHRMNGTKLAEHNVGGPDCGIYFSVFSGPVVRDPVIGIGPGATVQQDFKLFVHEFHNYEPPEDWQFSEDGDPPGPPQ